METYNWVNDYKELLVGAKKRFFKSGKAFLVVGLDENYDLKELFTDELPEKSFYQEAYRIDGYKKIALFKKSSNTNLEFLTSYDFESQEQAINDFQNDDWTLNYNEQFLKCAEEFLKTNFKYLLIKLDNHNNLIMDTTSEEPNENFFIEAYEIEKVPAVAIFERNEKTAKTAKTARESLDYIDSYYLVKEKNK